jgi:LPS sulfotransferase NodH
MSSNRPPARSAPFVVGAPRSGTTLLRLMLDAHREIAIPAETHFYPAVLAVDPTRTDWLDGVLGAITESHTWQDYGLDSRVFVRDVRSAHPAGPGDVLRTFYRAYAARFEKTSWGDKWPGNVLFMQKIAAVLPEARFVHIIRDGRDVAASLRQLWFRPGETYQDCIELWADRIRAARAQAATGLPYLEVRYESLVAEPLAVLARICDFIEFAYDDAMLSYNERSRARLEEIRDWKLAGRLVTRAELIGIHWHTHDAPSPDRIGQWKTVMSSEDVRACDRAAAGLLEELGYL